MASGPDVDALVANTIRELLDSAVGAPRRVDVVLRALHLAAADCIPAEANALATFLAGPMRTALRETLGDATGAILASQLEHVVPEAVSRAAGPAAARTAHTPVVLHVDAATFPTPTDPVLRARFEAQLPPAPATGSAAAAASPGPERAGAGTDRGAGPTMSLPRLRWPVVFLVTRDGGKLLRFSQKLAGKTQIEVVRDLFELVEWLERASNRLPIVVVDCPGLGVPVAHIPPMLPALPKDATLVMWGAPSGELEIAKLQEACGRPLIACSAEAAPEDVAMLLLPYLMGTAT
jgi:hypothetical protein